MFGAGQFINVSILTLLCVQFIKFSEGNLVANCLGKSFYFIYLFIFYFFFWFLLFVKICLSIFAIDVWDRLWVQNYLYCFNLFICLLVCWFVAMWHSVQLPTLLSIL